MPIFDDSVSAGDKPGMLNSNEFREKATKIFCPTWKETLSVRSDD